MEIRKYSQAEISLAMPRSSFVLITSASYEDRCLSLPRRIAGLPQKSIIFGVVDLCPEIMKNLEEMSKILRGARLVKTSISDPNKTAGIIDNEIQSIFKEGGGIDVVVDITTFTHEHLMFLVKSLYDSRDKINSLKCVYSGASDYSIAEKGMNKWLSKGCCDVRSVIGFPGLLYPGVDNVLIVIVGYEHERAGYVIDEMAPEQLCLGFGKPDSTTDDAHRTPMELFNRIVETNVAMRPCVHKFEFAANNPVEAFASIKNIVSMTPESNHVIVPMNTKLSTLAVAALALHDKNIQVCYAQPDTYNFTGYSIPNDTFHMFDATEFLLR